MYIYNMNIGHHEGHPDDLLRTEKHGIKADPGGVHEDDFMHVDAEDDLDAG